MGFLDRAADLDHAMARDSQELLNALPGGIAAWLAPARVYNLETGEGRLEAIRSNTAYAFDLAGTDMVLVLLRERLARLAGLPVAGFEPAQPMRYTPGQNSTGTSTISIRRRRGIATTWRGAAGGSPPVWSGWATTAKAVKLPSLRRIEAERPQGRCRPVGQCHA